VRIQYTRLALRIVQRASDPLVDFADELGVELRSLVNAYADDEEAEWILSPIRQHRALDRLAMKIREVLDSFVERQMVPPLRSHDEISTFFLFEFIDRANLAIEQKEVLARYRLHNRLLVLLQSMDADDFECLCGRLLREAGCVSAFVTRSSKDDGADFFGRFPLAVGEAVHIVPPARRLLGTIYAFLYGQAKRYSADNVVNVQTVRELVGAWRNVTNRLIDIALGQRPSAADENIIMGLRTVGYRAADPVVLIVASTSTFTEPAHEYARTAGVALLDGEQITQLMLQQGMAVEQMAAGLWTTDGDMLAAYCRGI
jgi:hypothetical protein